MRVWITRDKHVAVWSVNPKLVPNGKMPSADNLVLDFYEIDAFSDTFGFTPRKGSVAQYELTLTKIKT